VSEDFEGATTMCANEKEMSRWAKIRNSILATLCLVGVWGAAIMASQPSVTPPSLPVIKVAECRWVTTNEYVTTVSNWTIRIERGFVTDLASIGKELAYPLGLWNDSPSIRRGGLVHDALYALLDATGRGPIDRDTADALLELCCLQDGTAPAKAKAVRAAVSTWGWLAVERHTPESIAAAKLKVSVRVKEAKP